MKLHFILQQFPRTITRTEWREIWRWKRETEKALRISEEAKRKMLQDLMSYGYARHEFKNVNIINELINPPLIMHSKQKP